MNRICLLFSVAQLICFPASGATNGSRTGNSGSGIVCDKPSQPGLVESVRLLDYFEAEQGQERPGDFVLDLGAPTLTIEQRLEVVMKRLDRLDPSRAKMLRAEIDFFWDNVNVITGAIFEDLPDSDPLSFPRYCHIEQLAVQLQPDDYRPGFSKYNINGDLWNKTVMSSEHMAGLVLHEVVYNQALQLHHSNSKNARKFTSFLSSTRADTISAEAYWKLVDLLHMRSD